MSGHYILACVRRLLPDRQTDRQTAVFALALFVPNTKDGLSPPFLSCVPSATCRDTYGLPDSSYTRKGPEETRALCTAEYSDISPLTGGNVAFSTLEGRPSAYNFDASPELQVS